ncbi:hypothetical protein HT031_002999 [Scenedesmus sp. PABB004]|nr:hypothetical protein HT031_002999 [Scenedesmus sp. PABB004]
MGSYAMAQLVGGGGVEVASAMGGGPAFSAGLAPRQPGGMYMMQVADGGAKLAPPMAAQQAPQQQVWVQATAAAPGQAPVAFRPMGTAPQPQAPAPGMRLVQVAAPGGGVQLAMAAPALQQVQLVQAAPDRGSLVYVNTGAGLQQGVMQGGSVFLLRPDGTPSGAVLPLQQQQPQPQAAQVVQLPGGAFQLPPGARLVQLPPQHQQRVGLPQQAVLAAGGPRPIMVVQQQAPAQAAPQQQLVMMQQQQGGGMVLVQGPGAPAPRPVQAGGLPVAAPQQPGQVAMMLGQAPRPGGPMPGPGQVASAQQAFRAGAQLLAPGGSVSASTAAMMAPPPGSAPLVLPLSAGFTPHPQQLAAVPGAAQAQQPIGGAAAPGSSPPAPAAPLTPGGGGGGAATAGLLAAALPGAALPGLGVIGGQRGSKDGAAPPTAGSAGGASPAGSAPGTPARSNSGGSGGAGGSLSASGSAASLPGNGGDAGGGGGKGEVMRLVARSFIEAGMSLDQALTMIQPSDRALLAAAYDAEAGAGGAGPRLGGLEGLGGDAITMPAAPKPGGGDGAGLPGLSGLRLADDAGASLGGWGFSLFAGGGLGGAGGLGCLGGADALPDVAAPAASPLGGAKEPDHLAGMLAALDLPFGLVYGILVMLGIGTLLPLNVFLTEKEFFDIRLHVPPSSPAIADNFLSLFGLVFNGANLLAVLFVICLQQNLSLRSQIVNPLVVIFIVLASTAGVALQLDLSGESVAYYSLPALAVLGMSMAVLQGGVLNLASMFPPIYIQGFVVGAGLSGCATSTLSLLSQLSAKSSGAGGQPTAGDVAPAAFVYFGSASLMTGLCILCFSLLTKLKYSRAKLGPYLASRAAAVAAADRDLVEQLLPPPPALLPPGKDPDALPSYPYPHAGGAPSPYFGGGPAGADFYHASAAERGAAGGGLARDYYLSSAPGWAAAGGADGGLRASAAADAAIASGPPPGAPGGGGARGSFAFAVYAACMVLTMGCSLAVWPGITAFICSVDNPATTSPCASTSGGGRWGRVTGDLFVPITFVVFGVGDLAGRIASSWGPWGAAPPPALSLLAYALARFGLLGAILFCHVVTPTAWALPTLFPSDAYPLAFITLLGLTQGHLLSTLCMHAPALVPPGKEAEFGPVTGLCITVGSLMGSASLFFIMRAFTRA